MTRNGKIARLPHHIRGQLNRRLQNGEPGTELVVWLNSLPEVQSELKAWFGGRPINEQNLSEWKQGGYLEWLRHEESCAIVQQLTEHTNDLCEVADGEEISNRLAALLAVELARAAQSLLETTTDPVERWRRLQELLPQLAQMRRGDHRAQRLQLEQERWGREAERLDKEKWDRELAEEKRLTLAPLWGALKRRPLAEIFGGGENGEKIADFILSIQNMRIPKPGEYAKVNVPVTCSIKPDQTESK